MPSMPRPPHILPIIVLAQFAGTSLWFASNAVLADMQREWGLPDGALGMLTSSVQLGFIVGTLVFALANLADRLPPRLLFLVCSLLGAAANAAVALGAEGLTELIVLRFAVGFFLAGIYPVGMKIAASWYAKGLGHALGLLVGALVLGTAFPHLLKASSSSLDWRAILLGVSATAATGGVLLAILVPAGPHLPTKSAFDPSALRRIFQEPKFRSAAFGYFGHMWEVYAFWAFVPVLLTALLARHQSRGRSSSLEWGCSAAWEEDSSLSVLAVPGSRQHKSWCLALCVCSRHSCSNCPCPWRWPRWSCGESRRLGIPRNSRH